MNVGYFYHSEYAEQNSSGTQIINTVNALSAINCTPTLFAPQSVHEYLSYHDLSIDGRLVSRPFSLSNDTLDRAAYYALSLAHSIRAGIDAIYTRDVSFLRFLRLIPRRLHPPVVYEAHKSYAQLGDLSEADERRRLNRADGVVTISNGIREDLEQLGITVDAVVWDAANTDHVPTASKRQLRTEIGIDEDGPVFVYAGSLYASKYDIECLIDAFHAVTQHRSASLYIVGGDESNVERYQTYAANTGVAEAVHFVGHVSQQRVFEYLKAADVGVVVQQPADLRARKYTSPLKLFEYLVSGLVVVGTDVPSITEVAETEPRILTYEAGDVEDLSTVMEAAADKYREINPDETDRRYSYEHRAELIRSVLSQYVTA
ncbi:glycosyltransferase family 4 protein [Halovenus sp. HT40]|uniref:glycosyltransferase family 4 protein n=1 Tax=Halovenus sp. HT40 TaxID=3126691 RepID=UPI00300F570D